MAIDDNTLYGLTGAQVKELPGKIEAVKGLARELTAADYNWPTSDPRGVAMWLLPEGMYSCDATTQVYPDNGSSPVNRPLFFKFNYGDKSVMVYYDDSGSNAWKYWKTVTATGARNSYGRVTPEVIDSLTSTSTTSALSANQGKALNDKIGGDLSNLTTTDKTSLINAINEVAGQSGGGIIELTSADYNYDNDNDSVNDCVALWLLPDGVYTSKGANIKTLKNSNPQSRVNEVYIVTQPTSSRYGNIFVLSSSLAFCKGYLSVRSDGANSTNYNFFTEIADNLTSQLSTEALSARQGYILKNQIGSLANLTTTDKTNLVAAINEAAAGGGGSGVIELTSADYNWPTNNPNGIALWLLDSGMYQISCPEASITLYHYNGSSGSYAPYGDGTTFLVIENRSGGSTTKNIYINNYWYNDWASDGILNTGNYYDTGGLLMTHKSMIDSLTSSSTNAPLSAKQGKVLKDLIDSLIIKGTGAPTTSTVGTVGKLYEDTTNGNLYICTDATNPYVWEEVGSGGGGGPTVVQSTGTSTTDVMSQNAVTSMVFADPSTKNNIRIGNNAAWGTYGVAIGSSAKVGPYAIAIGTNTDANYTYNANYSIALGHGAKTTQQGQFDVSTGSSSNTNGYNSSNYRLLTGLYDGQSDHDAATYGQVISYSAINGAGAPTTATEGKYVGQLYYDTTNEAMYFLKTIDTTTTPATYTWEALGGGGGLDPNTTFWGQTASNGVVDGTINISSNSGLAGMSLGAGHLDIDRPASFYLRAKKNSSTYSNVLWWNSASNSVPSDVHLDAAGTKIALLTNEVRLGGRYSSEHVKISNVDTPQSDNDAATKGYVDTAVAGAGTATFTTNEWNALWA